MERQDSLLLVEDEHVLRTLVAQFLRLAGYRVVEACDGVEGVDRFRDSGPFGLVLLDLNMPRLDGVGACRQIRRLEPSQAVLIVSAAILPQHDRDLRAMGVEDYLLKPYLPDALLSRVRELVGGGVPLAFSRGFE